MAGLQEMWKKMNSGARAGLIIGSVTILLIAVVAGVWVLQKKYETLFADLEPQDAGHIVGELERMKVAYKLSDGGARILVPEEMVHKVRLKLMSSGVPLTGGVGFEIFDNTDFGMTEFAQKINYQRALQGELARTITSFKEIKFARVHLVLPEQSLFKQEKESPSASVTVFLKNNEQLRREQITGIQRLVTASVPGMDVSNVTIVNQEGIVLSSNATEPDGSEAISARLQKKQEVETYLTHKVSQVLLQAFGPGQALVTIDVTLNFDQIKTTREDILPKPIGTDAVIKRRESKQSGGGAKTDNVTTEVEYRLGRQVDQIVKTPGSIERMSVGVLVPDHTDADVVRKIKELVAMTVGVDPSRGDEIAIQAIPSVAKGLEHNDLIKTTSLTKATSGTDSGTPSQEIVANSHAKENSESGSLSSQSGGNISLFTKERLMVYWKAVRNLPVHYGILMVGLGLIACSIVLALFQRSRNRNRQRKRKLTPNERELVLARLREWLDMEEPAVQRGTK